MPTVRKDHRLPDLSIIALGGTVLLTVLLLALILLASIIP